MLKPKIENYEDVEEYIEDLKHYNKMTELEYERETQALFHSQAQERHRIENAETNKRDIAHFEREKDLILFRKDNWQKEGIKEAMSDAESIGYSEIDKYALMVLKHKYPEVKSYGDCTKINPEELPDFDILVGGFPCQAFSIAGKRNHIEKKI